MSASTRRKLIINPNLELDPVYHDGELRSVRIWAPVRGASRHYHEVSATRHQRAFQTLAAAAANDGRMPAVAVADALELRDLGVLIAPENVSEPVVFEIPQLEPSAAAARADTASDARVASPSFPLPMPEDDLRRFVDVIAHRGSVIWEQRSPISVINPWVVADARTSTARVLEAAPAVDDGFEAAASKAAQAFASRGYATVRLDLPREQLVAMQRYFESLIANGWLDLGDQQSRRYWVHNDPVAVMLQWRVLPLVRSIARAHVKPSYAYAVRYIAGAELPKHTDRAQCKYTVAVLLEVDGAEGTGISPWPLTLHPPEATESGVDVHQTIGEALMYFGQTIPHSRARLERCRSSTSLLLHYVDETFSGTLR
jgi:hypothetical protein